MCKNWKEKGVCKYVEKCLFAHGEHELTSRTQTTPTAAENDSKNNTNLKTTEILSEKVTEELLIC